MRTPRSSAAPLVVVFLLSASLSAQTTITSNSNTVTTVPSGSIGVSATASSASPDIKMTLGDSSSSKFRIFNSSSELFRVQANGYVGIGNAAPNSRLTVGTNEAVSNQIQILTDVSHEPNLLLSPYSNYAFTLGNFSESGGRYFEVRSNSGAKALTIGPNDTGNVGIGTASPAEKLDINGNLNFSAVPTGVNYRAGSWMYHDDTSAYTYTGSTSYRIVNHTGSVAIGTFTDGGNVGIGGPTSPSAKLEIWPYAYPVQFQDMGPQGISGFKLNMAGSSEIDVSGLQIGSMAMPVIQSAGISSLTLNPTQNDVVIGTGSSIASGSGNHGNLTVGGNVTVTGTVYANYQDVAEWVPSIGSMASGTVVVISDDANNTVMPSTRPYDTGVAGVVSPTPGVLLGVASASKAKIATTGRVRVRVDASKGPIRKGDLLVTSDRPGMAMKSEPIDVAGVKIHRPGTLIGKALEALASGEGEILVLLSLQ
jgi:hypothetical protein